MARMSVKTPIARMNDLFLAQYINYSWKNDAKKIGFSELRVYYADGNQLIGRFRGESDSLTSQAARQLAAEAFLESASGRELETLLCGRLRQYKVGRNATKSMIGRNLMNRSKKLAECLMDSGSRISVASLLRQSMASPAKVKGSDDWIELVLENVNGKSLEEVFLFMRHYQPQFTKNKEFSALLLSALEEMDTLSTTETMILRDLNIFAKLLRKANGNPPAKTSANAEQPPPGWVIQKLGRKKHICPCDNKCQLGDSCLLKSNVKLLCGLKFWATKNDTFTVDNFCYEQLILPLWVNSKKYFRELDGDLSSRAFFVQFTVPKFGFFKCCDPSCATSLGLLDSLAINVNSLAILDNKPHCFCDNCFEFNTSVGPDTKCQNCNFFLEDAYNRITLILSAVE